MRVILGSASPRRRELLAALVSEFEVASPGVPEDFRGAALDDARRLAAAKAEAVTACAGAVVIGADTIVFDGARLYGKPESAAEAREMLRELRGRAHDVVTGIAVSVEGIVESEVTVSRVWIAPLSDDDVERYVATRIPLDKAGAYAIQHEWAVVARLEGCYCNVVGLPLWKLRSLLERAGVACRRPDAIFARCTRCPDREETPGLTGAESDPGS